MKNEEQGLVAHLVECLSRVRSTIPRHLKRDLSLCECEQCDVLTLAHKLLARATPEAVRKADAAPEMYEALLDVEASLGDRLLAEGPLSPEYASAVLHKLRAAIAKAEGRTVMSKEPKKAVHHGL